jgi:hypothetical protein
MDELFKRLFEGLGAAGLVWHALVGGSVFVSFPADAAKVEMLCVYGELGEERCVEPKDRRLHVFTDLGFRVADAKAWFMTADGLRHTETATAIDANQACERLEKDKRPRPDFCPPLAKEER